MNTEAQFLGDLEPLNEGRESRGPDRREISGRWLTGSILVGISSLLLMSGALYAALDGREKLTKPADFIETVDNSAPTAEFALKGNHPKLIKEIQTEKTNVMMVSTVSAEGDTQVVKKRPFMNVLTSLALASPTATAYPEFNPLRVFSDTGDTVTMAKSSDLMYGADVDSEVKLSETTFPYAEVIGKIKSTQRGEQIQRQLPFLLSKMDEESGYATALSAFDIELYESSGSIEDLDGVTITAENVTLLPRYLPEDFPGAWYQKRKIEVRANAEIATILLSEGVEEREALTIEKILASDIGTNELRIGDQLHAHFRNETVSNGSKLKTIARISVFRGSNHLVSIGRNDGDKIVYATPPETPKQIAESERQILPKEKLPTSYDAIYRAALYEGLTPELAGSLIRIFAFNVDFKKRIGLTDEMEVFVSLEDGKEIATEESEILYASLKLGENTFRYYRFRDAETGTIDYYDQDGRSAKNFLLRKPVPNGRFRSGYGMRRHPISRRYKLHAGVDWSAPRGTPIIASGNGVVTQAKWAGGYGRQTIVRHANGYETSYSHQTAFAKGVRPGVRVRQGQVIGYVGSTGYSTGPHLHYEVKVNGNTVDPMRIRLPKGKVLQGDELALFEAERDRINALVSRGRETQLALN